MNVTAVTAAIAGLTIPGVTVVDLDGIVDEPMPRDLPLLMPSPDGMFSAPDVEYLTAGTTGPGTQAQTQRWTINYVLLHSDVGVERNLGKVMPALVDTITDVINAVQSSTTLYTTAGIHSIKPSGSPAPTVVQSATGRSYHGALLSWEVTQYA